MQACSIFVQNAFFISFWKLTYTYVFKDDTSEHTMQCTVVFVSGNEITDHDAKYICELLEVTPFFASDYVICRFEPWVISFK